MIRVRNRSKGYTIVETIIFLTVTGVLFASTILLVNGEQGKTEFSQAVREVQSQLQDVANDVSTGFYNNPGTYKCKANGPGGKPHVLGGSGVLGTNEECIFIGRAIQFAANGTTNPEQLVIYNIIGLRTDTAGKEVNSYFSTLPGKVSAYPTAVAKGSDAFHNGFPDTSQTVNMPGGLTAYRVQYKDSAGVVTNVAGFGIVATLAQYSLGVVASGAQGVNVVAFPASVTAGSPSPAATSLAFVDNINTLADASPGINPANGIIMCFNSATSSQHAVITFGKDKKLTPIVSIRSGLASTDPLTGECL